MSSVCASGGTDFFFAFFFFGFLVFAFPGFASGAFGSRCSRAGPDARREGKCPLGIRRIHADRQQIQQRQRQRDRQDDPQGRQSASLPCRFFLRVGQLHLFSAAAQLRDGLLKLFRALIGR